MAMSGSAQAQVLILSSFTSLNQKEFMFIWSQVGNIQVG